MNTRKRMLLAERKGRCGRTSWLPRVCSKTQGLVMISLFAAIVLIGPSCKNGEYHYNAARIVGFSMADWSGPSAQGGGSMGDFYCSDEQLKYCPELCDKDGKGKVGVLRYESCSEKLPNPAPPKADGPDTSFPFIQFLAVVDIDIFYEQDVSPVPDSPVWLRPKIKVLKVLDLIESRMPPGIKFDGTFNLRFPGRCDPKAPYICEYYYYVWGPLFAGPNLIFAQYEEPFCPGEGPPGWVITGAYVIEDGKIYDWWGYALDWQKYREILIKQRDEAHAKYPLAEAHEFDHAIEVACKKPEEPGKGDEGNPPPSPAPDAVVQDLPVIDLQMTQY